MKFLALLAVAAVAQNTGQRCGINFADANGRCGTQCPRGVDAECPAGQRCFAQLSTAPCNAPGPAPGPGCPRIYSRAEWGARASRGRTNMPNPVPLYVIHHGASATCNSFATCSQMVRNFQNQHMDANGWVDIGYQFVIGEDGGIYEGRGWTTTGAHCPAYNSASIGIAVVGDFTSRNPNAAAIAAVQALAECGRQRGHLTERYGIRGHRDGCATACPGNTFYSLIRTWPRFGQLTDDELQAWQDEHYGPNFVFNHTELGHTHPWEDVAPSELADDTLE